MKLFLASPLIVLLGPLVALAQAPSYSRQVQPLFARYCVECHNAKDPQGELNLESYKSLIEGGRHGAALVPGKPETSRLVRMVEGKLKPAMPPRKAKQPAPKEIALLRAWVAAGASDDGVPVRVVLPELAPKKKVGTPVGALAYDRTGKLLLAAGRGEVFVLDVGGDLQKTIPGQRDRVTALAFSKDGQRLAVASSTAGVAHEVRLYGPSLAGLPQLVTRHDDVVHELAFSPDGKLLASCGYDRLIKLWDVEAKREARVLRDHSDSVYGLAFSPDGKLLASGAADRAVKVWDVLTGNRLYTLGESTDWVYAVAWSPDGRHLAAAGVDRSIRIWEVDVRGGRVVHSVFAHEAPVTRLVYSPDGKVLYSASEDGGIKAWDSARMVERHVYAKQPEVPLALALRPDRKQLAVGRFDGAVMLLDEATGKLQGQPLPIRPKPPVLERLAPAAGARGRSVTVRLDGKHLLGAELIVPAGWKAVALPGGTADALNVKLTVSPSAPVGEVMLSVRTGGGASAGKSFRAQRFDSVAEVEPNDSPRTGQPVVLPVTVAGGIDKAGDVDYYRFEAKVGQEIGAEVTRTGKGAWAPVLALVGPDGTVVAESERGHLGHTASKVGTYSLGVRDAEYRGGAGMGYRLDVGDVPVVTSVFPLGARRGTETELRLDGVHLGKTRTVRLKVPATAALGSLVAVPFATPGGAPLGLPSVVVGEHPEVAGKGGALVVPGTANGTIEEAGSTQKWKFTARKGERLLLEVNARRLGSPLDSAIEILDAKGRPLPRATLRCLAKTYVAFRDHDSRGAGIRLEAWSELAVNDYLLVGSELLRIKELPRGPDDDCQFFSEAGQRLGFLGTTPTFQSQGQAMYKVAIHPPGTTFPPNGLPVVTLFWRNDDGGPGFGKDSRLVFDPPTDGEYQVRVGDSRGEGSRAHAYRLTVRPPRPDFTIAFGPPAPVVSKGSAVPIRATAKRVDEFEGPIHLKLHNLPPGFEAPETTIPAGESSTSFALYASPLAKALPKGAPLKLEGKATIGGKAVVREASGGAPGVIEPGDVVVTTEQSEVTVKPGGEVRVAVKIERRNNFKGRVPLEVLGLPHGLRVLDVGLNGILITEAETTRTFVVYAEPWMEATTRPFVVFARREGRGTEHAAKSVLLRVEKGK